MTFLAQLPKEQLAANLQNGLILMLLGMGTVFVFLTLLIFLMKGMSAFVRNHEAKKPVSVITVPTAAAASGTDAEIAAAIVAAVAKSKK